MLIPHRFDVTGNGGGGFFAVPEGGGDGIGDQQLDVVISKLQTRYKVDVVLSKPKFAFRETLRKKVKVQGKHKKQDVGQDRKSVV